MSNPLLMQIRIASPCSADWNEMRGNDRVRFCDSCRKNVYDISTMTTKQAREFIQNAEGRACVTYYARRDGTVLTTDCPAGRFEARRSFLMNAAAATGAFALIPGAVNLGTALAKHNAALAPEEDVEPVADKRLTGMVAVDRPDDPLLIPKDRSDRYERMPPGAGAVILPTECTK
jgi:hypothetical protein